MIPLKLQQFIEEKRLIFADFLLKKFRKSSQKSQNIFAQKFTQFLNWRYFLSFSCALIILFSIFIRSTRDIGQDSAVYIEMAQKILAGKKFYFEIFETNFPLAIYLYTIPVYLARILNFSPIIAIDFFVNFLGIISLFSCYKIFISHQKRFDFAGGFVAKITTKIAKFLRLATSNRTQLHLDFKLILIGFCAAYFLRFFTLQYNEFSTKTSFLLAFAFPYIALQFFPKKNQKTQIIQGVLAGLIACLKPHYAILIIAFEATKFIKKPREIFNINNFTALFVVIIYLILIAIFAPEFLQNVDKYSAIYYQMEYIPALTFGVFIENIFPFLLLFILLFDELKKNPLIKKLLIAFLAFHLILLSETLNTFDQRSSAFAMFYPLLFLLLKEIRIAPKNLLLFFFTIIIFQFEPIAFYQLFINLCAFWWLLIFAYKKYDYRLIFLAFLSLILLILSPANSWKMLPFLLIILFIIKEQIFFKKYHNNNLSKPYTFLLAIAFAYFLHLFLSTVFGTKNLYAFDQKSPNSANEKRIETILQNAQNDEVLVISPVIHDLQPALIYAHKTNPLPFHHLNGLYQEIIFFDHQKPIFHHQNDKQNQVLHFMMNSVKNQMKNPKNKLIFVKKSAIHHIQCGIDFLEFYFLHDQEFAQIFLQNYRYFDSGFSEIISQKMTDPNSNQLREIKQETRKTKFNEFEIYIRK